MEDDKQLFKNKAHEFEGIYKEFLFKLGELQKKQTLAIEDFRAKLKEAKLEEIRNTIKNKQAN